MLFIQRQKKRIVGAVNIVGVIRGTNKNMIRLNIYGDLIMVFRGAEPAAGGVQTIVREGKQLHYGFTKYID